MLMKLRSFELKQIIPFLFMLLVVGLVTFSYRSVLSFKYDPPKYEDLYNNSQYVWPRGSGVLGDDTLYKVIGYKLISGENPFFMNYETPPFGKSLYGLAEYGSLNPYYVSGFFYLLSIFCVYSLAQIIFKNKLISWLSAFIFALNPLTAYQVGQTMLDLPMTVFMMLHIIFLFRSKQSNKKIINIILSGIFLGLMAGTKIGYYIPAIILIDLIFLTYQKYSKFIVALLPSIVIGYVLSYFSYFIRHPNPIPWIRLHQKIIDYYSGSRGISDYFNETRTVFLNQYQGWWRPDTINMVEWSILLPIGVLATVWFLVNIRKYIKTNIYLAYLVVLGVGLLVMNSLIPFWPRYLMIVIPILSIVVGNLISKNKIISLLFFMIYIPSFLVFLKII